MRICVEHLTELRAALAERGLDKFVADSDAEIARRMGDEDPRASFEPLVGVHNALMNAAIRAGGIDVLLPFEDGTSRCMACCVGGAAVLVAADEQLAAAYKLEIV